MRRGTLAIVSLALAGCGARTALDEPLPDSGAGHEGDAAPEADAPSEAGPHLCPLTPPAASSACEASTMAIQCAYLSNPPGDAGIEAWACLAGTWVYSTTCGYQRFRSCSDIVCSPPTYVECIIGDGEQCCTCGSDQMVDQCGPC
jgi:hypothetical protein